jgi:hypothetical protein
MSAGWAAALASSVDGAVAASKVVQALPNTAHHGDKRQNNRLFFMFYALSGTRCPVRQCGAKRLDVAMISLKKHKNHTTKRDDMLTKISRTW